MAFKSVAPPNAAPDDPEALLRDLKGRKIPGLLAHQADMVRSYNDRAVAAPDVALQLPTGSGKTLIGLLLGEWRRKKFGERVLYLCPTRQLVNQVVEQAKEKYGMNVAGFVGSKREYVKSDVSAYERGEVIAVTTYSALFNSNPFFKDPQLVILDDAHAAEGYIANNWSLRIERNNPEHTALHAAIASALASELSPVDQRRLIGESYGSLEKSWVDKIPTPTIVKHFNALHAILAAGVMKSKLRFPWMNIQDHLSACHWYLGPQEILIRPLLPPTSTHAPFANARQRIYMSATLGEGGDLERITGRRNILRLPIPPGWDKQGIGRRFIVFPELSLRTDEIEPFTDKLIGLVKRALFLVPDDERAAAIGSGLKDRLDVEIFDGQLLEKSMNSFRTATNAVAVVANRYDGIDFPQDDCRLEIVEGVPKATNLQERFLVTRMAALVLLRDRIQTRLVQALGRCTREDTDYALILVRGEEMHAHFQRKENRIFLHPELQAELEFGLEQSKESDVNAQIENAKLFFAQGKPWDAANAAIIQYRSTFTQQTPPGTSQLRAAVEHEVVFQEEMWHGNYESALQECQTILAALTNVELRGYRALWYYLAGTAAWLAAEEGADSLRKKASHYFEQARKAAPGVRWLSGLSKWRTDEPTSNEKTNDQLMTIVERMEQQIEHLGTSHDRNFAKEEARILTGLLGRKNVPFEEAHIALGQLLGFLTGPAIAKKGAPDAWWLVDETLCFVFEDHSDAESTSSLDLKKARQADSHPNWILSEMPVLQAAEIVPVLVTPVKKADKDALPHLVNVALWPLEDFREWGTQALQMIRQLRVVYPGEGDLEWRAMAAAKYDEFGLSPAKFAKTLRTRQAATTLS